MGAAGGTEWIWNHIRLELPDAWEMLRFSRDPDSGRCGFADRFGFRVELTWRRVPGAPDCGRVLSDYRARLEREGAEDVRLARCGRHEGLEAVVKGLRSTRYGRHLPGESCFVEVVFLWPQRRDEALELAVLDSLRAEPPLPDGGRRWRAFGAECRVPQGSRLTACEVVPGRAELRFGRPESCEAWRFVRLGMVDEWLREDVAAWLPRQASFRARGAGGSRRAAQGHDVCGWQGLGRPGLLRVGGGVRVGRLAVRLEAWRCPADHRLYLAEHAGPSRRMSPACDLFGRRLLCKDLNTAEGT